jgi:hypothetical protein
MLRVPRNRVPLAGLATSSGPPGASSASRGLPLRLLVAALLAERLDVALVIPSAFSQRHDVVTNRGQARASGLLTAHTERLPCEQLSTQPLESTAFDASCLRAAGPRGLLMLSTAARRNLARATGRPAVLERRIHKLSPCVACVACCGGLVLRRTTDGGLPPSTASTACRLPGAVRGGGNSLSNVIGGTNNRR